MGFVIDAADSTPRSQKTKYEQTTKKSPPFRTGLFSFKVRHSPRRFNHDYRVTEPRGVRHTWAADGAGTNNDGPPAVVVALDGVEDGLYGAGS